MLFGIVLAWSLATAPVSPPAPSSKTVHFIGFSNNDQLSAWRVEYGSGSHALALVRVIDTTTHALVASFKDSPPHPRPPDQSMADYEDWCRAAPQAAWRRLQHAGHFGSLQLDFKDTLVRLLPDDDDGHVVVKAQKKVMHVQGVLGQPLGYAPVARLFEGEFIALGHFRTDAQQNGAALGYVAVYVSHDGHCIAVLNKLLTPAGQVMYEAYVTTTRADDPLASTKVGAYRMYQEQSRSLQDEFKSMHPKEGADYGKYVGRWF